MKFKVIFEASGFTNSNKLVYHEFTTHEAAGFTEVSLAESTFPSNVLAVLGGAISENDGHNNRGIHLLVCVDLLVEAKSDDEAKRMAPPEDLLTKIADLMSSDFDLDLEAHSWKVTEVQDPESKSTQVARAAGHMLWLNSLSDDELADAAEQARDRQDKQRAEHFRQSQRLAFQSLRAVISDCLSESPIQHDDFGVQEEKRIVAVFQPQAWINDYATDIDGQQNVDVTDRVLALTLDRIHALQDHRDSTDDLVDGSMAAIEHDGPFTVCTVDGVCEFFGVDKLSDITEDLLHSARQRAAKDVSEAVDAPTDSPRG